MIKELHNEAAPVNARMLAGLMMKNAIYSKNEVKCGDLQQAWLAIDKATRNQVKAGCLQTLLSPDQGVRNQSAQVLISRRKDMCG